ncbi:hypothetical protein BDB00DRAFT_807774, partial [Zychaea mexicana]|uniref:uncharacterized protein n=1 Tax=Zychaea mexicana TaxID=64656 RepID=UPI0022FE1E50
MQQNPQFQFQAQQQFQHFQDSQHQQPTAATTTPSAPVVSSSSASGEQQQSYNQYDLQQFLQNTQFLAQASQAMDTTTATPIYFNPTIEMILDEPAVTTGTLGDGTMDAATTVVNTTMTTQANYQNILPTTTMMMPMFGSSAAVSNAALAAPGGDDLQNYFVPYPTTTITY